VEVAASDGREYDNGGSEDQGRDSKMHSRQAVKRLPCKERRRSTHHLGSRGRRPLREGIVSHLHMTVAQSGQPGSLTISFRVRFRIDFWHPTRRLDSVTRSRNGRPITARGRGHVFLVSPLEAREYAHQKRTRPLTERRRLSRAVRLEAAVSGRVATEQRAIWVQRGAAAACRPAPSAAACFQLPLSTLGCACFSRRS
jgi:hypothetical protein